jgi:hypothetical protein
LLLPLHALSKHFRIAAAVILNLLVKLARLGLAFRFPQHLHICSEARPNVVVYYSGVIGYQGKHSDVERLGLGVAAVPLVRLRKIVQRYRESLLDSPRP